MTTNNFDYVKFPDTFEGITRMGHRIVFRHSGARDGDRQQYYSDHWDMCDVGWDDFTIYIDITIEDKSDSEPGMYECSYVEAYYNDETNESVEYNDGYAELYNNEEYPYISDIHGLDDGIDAVKSVKKMKKYDYGYADMVCMDCGRPMPLGEKDRIMEHAGHLFCPGCGHSDFVRASRRKTVHKSQRGDRNMKFNDMVKARRYGMKKYHEFSREGVRQSIIDYANELGLEVNESEIQVIDNYDEQRFEVCAPLYYDGQEQWSEFLNKFEEEEGYIVEQLDGQWFNLYYEE